MSALSLALHFIRREIRSRYLGSFSGGLWALFQPLIQLAVYSFVFVYVFKAHCEPYQALTDTGVCALVFGKATVRGAGGVRDGGFGIAQIGRNAAHLRGINDMESPFPCSLCM